MRMEPEVIVSSEGRAVMALVKQTVDDLLENGTPFSEALESFEGTFRVTNPNGPEDVRGTLLEVIKQGAPLAINGLLAAMATHIGETWADGVIKVERLS